MARESEPSDTEISAARPFGRSLEDFRIDTQDTPHGRWPAEERLLESARMGDPCVIGDERPDKETDSNKVRAGFIRFLALGGDARTAVHEKGVWLVGAYVDGDLDFAGCDNVRSLKLLQCWISGRAIFRGADIQEIILSGSRVHGILGEDAIIAGNVFMNNGFKSVGEVLFLGAEISGSFECKGGRFENGSGDALSFDRANIAGSVFLTNGFEAVGVVRFAGAAIGGNLGCSGGSFKNHSGDAILASSSKIRGTLWLGPAAPPSDKQCKIEGDLDLRDAHAAVLVDHRDSWPSAKVFGPDGKNRACHIYLDGFTYGQFAPGSSLDVADRMAWLQRQHPDDLDEDFKPQPFEQLMKVYREMGHEDYAKKIGFLKAKTRLRRSWTNNPWHKPVKWWWNPLNLVKWLFLERIIGYGYRIRGLIFIAVFTLGFAWWVFYQAGQQGVMAPTSPFVFLNSDLNECRGIWVECQHRFMINEHTPFYSLLYAVDALLPLVSLGQEAAWAPMQKAFALKLPGGIAIPVCAGCALGLLWFEIILGWVVGLVLVALISGVIRRD